MRCTTERRYSRGFTLVELMIALVLGLIVIGSALALFVSQRVTSNMSGQMVDIQSEGRMALDAMARDFHAAGDFGCWPVSNPIDGRLNQMVFDVNKGGILGFDNGTALNAAASSATDLYGLAGVQAASPDTSSLVMLTGVGGSLSATVGDMAKESDPVVVKTPAQPFKANDVAVITDCIDWVKFQITDVQPGAAAGTVSLAHIGGQLTAWGKGNQTDALGAMFRLDSTVARLDSIWWFVGTPAGGKHGLYRFSPSRDSAPVLVSDKVQAVSLRYDVDADGDGVADAMGQTAAQVTDWRRVKAASLEVLLRSATPVSGAGSTTVTSFAGQTVPADNHLYVPLSMMLTLRNQ